MNEKMLTVHEASEVLKLSRRTVYGMCRDGKLLGAEKIYGKWMVPRSAVDMSGKKPVGKRSRPETIQGSADPQPPQTNGSPSRSSELEMFLTSLGQATQAIHRFSEQLQNATEVLAALPVTTATTGSKRGKKGATGTASSAVKPPQTTGEDAHTTLRETESLELSSIVPRELRQHSGENCKERYRALTFSEIIGNEAAVESLQLLAKERRSKNFLVTGPTGTGKTALAWVYARSIACDERPEGTVEPCGTCKTCVELDKFGANQWLSAVEQVDIATFKAPDQAAEKALQELSQVRGDVVIVNEAERLLVKQLRLLAVLDQNPKAAVFFSSTDLSKFDDQFKGRCQLLATRPLRRCEMLSYVLGVCKSEGVQATAEEANEFLEEMGEPRNSQIRDVLMELDAFLLRNKVQD